MNTTHADSTPTEMAHVPWSRHAAICQVNVRQFSAAHKDCYKLDAHGEIFPVAFNAGAPDEAHGLVEAA
jgi:hypothetical protein